MFFIVVVVVNFAVQIIEDCRVIMKERVLTRQLGNSTTGWSTGATALTLIVRFENGEINIYNKHLNESSGDKIKVLYQHRWLTAPPPTPPLKSLEHYSPHSNQNPPPCPPAHQRAQTDLPY